MRPFHETRGKYPNICVVVHACMVRHERDARDAVAHAGSQIFAPKFLDALDVLAPSLPDAMAPKTTDAAYGRLYAAIPDVRSEDWQEIARFLSTARQLMHSGGLRHAFARLELDVIQRFEQECSIWRAQTLTPPVMATPPQSKAKAKPLPVGLWLDEGFEGRPSRQSDARPDADIVPADPRPSPARDDPRKRPPGG